MRSAFSMVTAIFIMILMATVSIFVLNTAGKITKESTLLYRAEQAALLTRSYTELAIFSVTNFERNATTPGKCIENITGTVDSLIPSSTAPTTSTGNGYYVRTNISYLGNGLPCTASRILNTSAISTDYNGTLATGPKDELAAVIIDVFVTYSDPDRPSGSNDLNITFHRRTLQKI